MSKLQFGLAGEQIAVDFLQNKGYKILERNFRIKGGEVDIIALDKQTLVFVEVKTRSSHEYGPPAEAITPPKIRNVVKTAYVYMLFKKLTGQEFRIDAVTVDFTDTAPLPKVEHFESITN